MLEDERQRNVYVFVSIYFFTAYMKYFSFNVSVRNNCSGIVMSNCMWKKALICWNFPITNVKLMFSMCIQTSFLTENGFTYFSLKCYLPSNFWKHNQVCKNIFKTIIPKFNIIKCIISIYLIISTGKSFNNVMIFKNPVRYTLCGYLY